jgi:hypothetical protein
MAFWGVPYQADEDREPGFFWHDGTVTPGDVHPGDGDDTGDLFGQFVDFDDPHPSGGLMTMGVGMTTAPTRAMPGQEDPFLLDQPSDSIGSSTGDDLDFLSSSTDADATASSVYDVDPRTLAGGVGIRGQPQRQHLAQHVYTKDCTSTSDTDLPCLEGISLSSPTKKAFSPAKESFPSPAPQQLPQPSPSPPKTSATAGRRASRIVEAVGATIRKATAGGRKKQRKPLPPTPARPGSPTFEDDQLMAPRQRPRQRNGVRESHAAEADGHLRQGALGGEFVMGPCDDPFHDAPSLPPPPSAIRYDQREGVSPPLMSPAIKSEASAAEGIWPHSIPSGQWNGTPMGPGTPSWWEYDGAGAEPVSEMNMMNMAALQAQQAEALQYHQQQQQQFQPSFQDTGASGLMIHIPPPGHVALPPATAPLERTSRPPKAPSSGARHLSHSPVRRTRARSRVPSASASTSPTRSVSATNQGHSRHSSNGSVASVRSASGGRLPASMPGTPCSVRKRRSRDVSGSAGASSDIGFVNFTPSDGGMLMTGVAPSGSSKTKARREKEAAERRRKMNEAAIRAVAAAGGDVDRLMQQGFAF